MTDEKVYSLNVQEVLSLFCSGITSGAAQVLARQGVPREIAERAGHEVGQSFYNRADVDPAVRSTVLDAVARMLDGSAPAASSDTSGAWL